MGAIIGGVYALKKDISAIEKIAEKYSKISEFNIDLSFSEKERKDKPFFLKKMSDFLKRGYILNLELRDALLASASIPGMFPPVILDKKILVDGGIIDVVPIEVAQSLGANFVIAVSVSQTIKKRVEFNNAVEIFFRSDSITSAELRKLQLSFADVVITPKVGRFHWSDFSKPEQCIREGEVAAQNAILELKKKLKKVKPGWWKRLFY
jgi:NTE family protein